MQARRIGRALGIGVRVAGRIAGKRLAAYSDASAVTVHERGAARTGSGSNQASGFGRPPARAPAIRGPASGQAAGRIAGETARGVSRGIGGFLRPFRRAGGIVWLEVTGTFFLLFAAVFALRLWQNWAEMAKNTLTRDVAIAAAAVFLYLGVSSFWRARRR